VRLDQAVREPKQGFRNEIRKSKVNRFAYRSEPCDVLFEPIRWFDRLEQEQIIFSEDLRSHLIDHIPEPDGVNRLLLLHTHHQVR
jgi:hypothetical protein